MTRGRGNASQKGSVVPTFVFFVLFFLGCLSIAPSHKEQITVIHGQLQINSQLNTRMLRKREEAAAHGGNMLTSHIKALAGANHHHYPFGFFHAQINACIS